MNSKILAVACAILVVAAACKKNQKDLGAENNEAFAGVAPTPCNTCGQTKTTVVFAADTVINGTLNLCPDKTYILAGKMWVNNGGKIVIPAGTVIKGRKNATPATASALVITKGGKIEASGTTSCPVIFTSESDSTGGNPKPGDWGGVVILGRSKVNAGTTGQIEGITGAPAGIDYTYGGTDTTDNSGWLRFTRIQYAGAVVSANNELNGLTCGGVGCGTELDHVEVFRGADDGFEFFGGTVNGKYLLSVSNNDDQFDFDFGYRGNLQYIVAILEDADSLYSNNNTNGIESDNNPTNNLSPITRPVISNMTIAGPANNDVQVPFAILNGVRFRNGSRFVIRNSIIYNFPTAARLESTATINSVSETDTCGVHPDSSYFFNNTVYGTANYAGWSPNPVGQDVANSSSLVLASPNSYNDFFSPIARGLRATGAPANGNVRFCGLAPTNCGFSYGTTTTKGGAVDNLGNYWLSAVWIQK